MPPVFKEICVRCNKRNIRYPKIQLCNVCYTTEYIQKHPNKKKYRYGGHAEEVLARDNFTCQLCGKNQNEVTRLEIHHIDGNGTSKNGEELRFSEQNNNINNLITLCVGCHRKTDWWKKRLKPRVNKTNIVAKCLICGEDRKIICKGICGRCYQKNLRDYKIDWYTRKKKMFKEKAEESNNNNIDF